MYKQFVNKRAPISAWIMDTAIPFQDLTGFGKTATKKAGTADPSTSVPLVSGAAYSSVFDKASIAEWPQNIFKVGLEDRPFALEAWVLPVPKSEGNVAQTYRENVANYPAPISDTDTMGSFSGWYLNAGYWGSETSRSYPTDGIFARKYLRRTVVTNTHPTSNGVIIISGNTDNTPSAGTGAPVVAGQVYCVSFWYRTSLATFTAALNAKAYDDAGNQITITDLVVPSISVVQNQWTRMYMTFTAPPGATRITARTSGHGAAVVGSTFDATGLMVTTGGTSLYPFNDGNSPGWEWTGTVGQSKSRTRSDVAAVNLLPHPSAVNTYWGATGYGTGGAGTLTFGNAGRYGAPSATQTWTTIMTSGGGTLNTGTGTEAKIPVTPGFDYTVSFDVQVNQTSPNICLYVQYADSYGAFINNLLSPVVTVQANTLTKLTYTFTMPSNAVLIYGIGVRLNAPGTNTNGFALTASSGMVVQGSTAPANQFDGNTPGAYWIGATNNSASYSSPSSMDQQILSHNSSYDGLSINGKVVRFGTSYATAGDAFIDYDLGDWKMAHVVGVHNANQNLLYVNGELVNSISLTDAQKADTYIAAANGFLYSGGSVGSNELAMNGVAFYPTLSGEQVKLNYLAGTDFIGQKRVAPQYGGTAISMAGDTASVYYNKSYLTSTDFVQGRKNNVEFAPDQINPSYVSGVPIAGDWTIGLPLDAQGDTSIYGVLVTYSAKNVAVDASLDGLTWTKVVSGELVTIIPNGMDPTGKDLQVRATFQAGQTDAWLESLTVTAYRNANIISLANRTITSTYPAVARQDYETNLYRDDNGIYLDGASVTIGPDTGTDPDVARTVEIWYKSKGGPLTHNIVGTSYRNGVALTPAPQGEWSLLHVVADADITGSITLSGDVVIGQMTIYPTALTATNILNIWKSYTGSQVVRFDDNVQSIRVTEGAVPAAIYAKDWAISSAG